VRADRVLQKRSGEIHVSGLLLLEFRQSVRFQVRVHTADKTKGFGKREADKMLADLEFDLHEHIFAVVEVDWAAVHHKTEELSSRYTEKHGHRLIDIMHVATALELSSTEFLTFDENQKRLAKAAGLKVIV
jgi:predicted nucleic acid-binding protein